MDSRTTTVTAQPSSSNPPPTEEDLRDMDRATVLKQLAQVAEKVLGADPKAVTEVASFKDDLDADSLDLVEVVMELEERFAISVPEDKLDGITTVGEAVDLVLSMARPAKSAGRA